LSSLVPRSISLQAQLLIAFVGLVVGTTLVLTVFAYRSSLESLEADARRSARVAADERAEAVTRLFASRQQRAEGFLAAAESLCAEPRGDGRLAWSRDCVETLMHEFRETERASSVVLVYRGFPFVRSGRPIASFDLPASQLARAVPRGNGVTEYLMRATRRDAQLLIDFDGEEVVTFFHDRSGLGAAGEVFLTDGAGAFLTPPRYAAAPAAAAGVLPGASVEICQPGSGEVIDVDYRGVQTIHSFSPVSAVGGCVDAHVAYAEAMAPAEALRAELTARGAAFALAGALLSLFAAQWISSPVRRLVLSAQALQDGQFRRPVPIGGPTEVRALGHALSTMSDALSRLVSREQAARLEAERANSSKDEFLATVSHELRTPLTAILGWARLLRDARLDPPAAARAIAAIERNAQAQRRLVEDLLDVSRIVRGELHFDRTAVTLAMVIDAALETVTPQAAEKGVIVERIFDDARMMVLGDGQRLQQVVWNLVWNAVKFTPPGGRVQIALRRRGEDAELTVSDTGVGIPKEFLPHVFEWFRQADTAPTRAYSGLGLGLGLVKQIAESHGGTVRAESNGQGTGSTFVVTLPLHDPASLFAQRLLLPPAAPRTVVDLQRVRVLVVDDDPETVAAVRALLEDAGAAVDTAGSAADARRELNDWHPDVLISDLAMPHEDGYMLMRSLRDAHVNIPAIALSAYAQREDAERAVAAGFQVHLAKPVDPSDLLDTIASLARPV
jgi:signal transduction histidine kinase